MGSLGKSSARVLKVTVSRNNQQTRKTHIKPVKAKQIDEYARAWRTISAHLHGGSTLLPIGYKPTGSNMTANSPHGRFFAAFWLFARFLVFPFPLPFFFTTGGVDVAVGAIAPRRRIRPSFSVSVIIGLAAGLYLCSFEYLQ